MSTERALSPTRHRPVRLTLALLILFALALQGLAVRPTAAAGIPTTLQISATATSISIGGTSDLTARLLDENGDPINGITVFFEVDPPLGTLDVSSRLTDPSGNATVTFTATADGSATITVYTDAPNPIIVETISIEINPTINVDELTFTSNASIILGNGTAQAELTAKATLAGNPLVNYTINFSTNLGSLSATSAQTNVNGEATVTLTSQLGGTAEVRAATAGGEITRILNITITPSIASVTISANPTTLDADGVALSTISAIPRQGDPAQTPVPADQVITFTTSLGTFGNGTNTLVTTTDDTGTVTATLKSVTSGIATVTATAANGVNNSVNVTFNAVAQALGVVAIPNAVPANNTTTATISATLIIGGAPAANESITFATNVGTLSAASAQTNANGVATVTIRSGTEGLATVTASYGLLSNTTSVAFTPVASSVATVANPDEIRGNGFDATIITAVVRSAAGTLVANAPVTFTTTFGNLSNVNAITDVNGRATTTLTANSDVARAVGVTATIATGASSSTTVTVLPSLTPDPPVIVTPAEDSIVGNLRPIITGTVTTGAGSIVEVFLGNSLTDLVCPSIIVGIDNTWSCTPTFDFTEGPVLVRARVTDTEGNPPSSRTPRNFIVDVTAPAAPVLLSPTEGATTSPRPTISGTAVGEAGGTVTVTSDGGIICTAIVAADGSWSCTLTADLPAGANTITATVTDQAGNTSSEATRSFTVNADAVTAPAFNPPLTVGIVRPTISGTADAAATITLTLTLLDSSTVTYVTTANAQGVWSVDLATATPVEGALPTAGLAEGTYPLIAQASNAVGTTSPTTTATLRIDLTAPQPPVITNLVDNALLRGLTELIGTAEANSVIRISFAPTTADPTATNFPLIYLVTADAEGNWRLDLTTATPESGSLPLPTHVALTVTATATDAVGNTSGATSRRFTIAAPIYMPLIFTFVNE